MPSLPIINLLSWAKHLDLNFNSDLNGKMYRPDNLFHQIVDNLEKRLNTGYQYIDPNIDVLPEDMDGITSFSLEKDGVKYVNYKFSEESGYWCCKDEFNLTDIEFFLPYSYVERPSKIKISEEIIKESENIDDQFYRYKGINIYKDDESYFTTPNQLDNQTAESILSLFGIKDAETRFSIKDIKNYDFKYVFTEIVNVLFTIGFIKSNEFFDLLEEKITGLNKLNITKDIYLDYVADKKILYRESAKFLQLPFNPRYLLSTSNDSNVIKIIDTIEHRSCRIMK